MNREHQASLSNHALTCRSGPSRPLQTTERARQPGPQVSAHVRSIPFSSGLSLGIGVVTATRRAHAHRFRLRWASERRSIGVRTASAVVSAAVSRTGVGPRRSSARLVGEHQHRGRLRHGGNLGARDRQGEYEREISRASEADLTSRCTRRAQVVRSSTVAPAGERGR